MLTTAFTSPNRRETTPRNSPGPRAESRRMHELDQSRWPVLNVRGRSPATPASPASWIYTQPDIKERNPTGWRATAIAVQGAPMPTRQRRPADDFVAAGRLELFKPPPTANLADENQRLRRQLERALGQTPRPTDDPRRTAQVISQHRQFDHDPARADHGARPVTPPPRRHRPRHKMPVHGPRIRPGTPDNDRVSSFSDESSARPGSRRTPAAPRRPSVILANRPWETSAPIARLETVFHRGHGHGTCPSGIPDLRKRRLRPRDCADFGQRGKHIRDLNETSKRCSRVLRENTSRSAHSRTRVPRPPRRSTGARIAAGGRQSRSRSAPRPGRLAVTPSVTAMSFLATVGAHTPIITRQAQLVPPPGGC